MDEHRFKQIFRIAKLISRYIKKNLPRNKQSELNAWIKQRDENRKLFEELNDPAQLQKELERFKKIDERSESVHKRLMKQIREDIQPVHKPRTIPMVHRFIAAAILVLFIATCLRWYWAQTPKTNDTIIIANGEPTYHSLKIPEGSEARLELNDGTNIALKGASLNFPNNFTSTNRTMRQLSGKGHYKVPANKKPITVVTNDENMKFKGKDFHLNINDDKTVVLKSDKVFSGGVTIEPDGGIRINLETFQKIETVGTNADGTVTFRLVTTSENKARDSAPAKPKTNLIKKPGMEVINPRHQMIAFNLNTGDY